MTSRETGRGTSRDTTDVERAVAALSGDPLLAGQEGAPASILVWDAPIRRVLYASEAAAPVRALVADPSGRVRLGRPARERLAALAGGLAGRDRFRLELLRLGRDRSSPSTMLACRRLDLGGRQVLMTVVVGGAPNLPPIQPFAGSSAEPSAPLSAAIEDVTAPTPGRAERAVSGVAARPRGSMARRFLWSTDAAGRIASVSPGLAAAVGAEHANIVGRGWTELADRTLLDPMGTVARHLASGRAWRDVEVAWRTAEPGWVVPVTLGAMPVRTREGALEGYRGSGLVRLPEMVRLGVERPVARDPEAETPALAEPAPAEPAPVEPGSVEAGTVEAGTTLSFSERGALHEIARALGGRFDHAEDAPDPGRASADIIPLPSQPPGARPREVDPLGLLDRLPVGIAVFRGETPIYLNATLLALTGCADLAEVVAHGALQALAGAEDGPAATVLATRSGASVGVEAAAAGIAWGELRSSPHEIGRAHV